MVRAILPPEEVRAGVKGCSVQGKRILPVIPAEAGIQG